MKKNFSFVLLGLVLFVALCFVPAGQAQACLAVSSTPSAPWQVGLHCNFTSASTGFPFRAPGVTYWQIFFVPSGTVSAATLSLDSSATGLSYSTGGVITSGTIGAMTSVGSYQNTSATNPTEFAQLTPTITGSGQVSVTLFGYNVNPSASGSIAGSVSVTSLPALPNGSNAIGSVTATQATGSNLHTAVDSLPALPSGSNAIGSVTATQGTGSNLHTAVDSLPALPAGTNAVGTVAPTLASGTLVAGQQAVTATAAALPTQALTRPVCVLALATNSLTVYAGASGVTTATGFALVPGSSLCLPVSNLNLIFVVASGTGSSVTWVAQ
jgi:hypothetical protein